MRWSGPWTIVGRTLVANRLLAGSACGKVQRGRPLNSVVRLHVNIRPAVEKDGHLLSALAAKAKAHWGYSAEALETWRSQLTISSADIGSKVMFAAVIEDELVGFYSLTPTGSSWELDNLWVLPQFMHRGIGRALVSHALEIASSRGAVEVTVDSDPNAEAFYLACGAVRRGEVPAPITGEPHRVRPQLAFNGRRAT
jgi:ribosomal protein S18 acetylase RimI-like enzyme